MIGFVVCPHCSTRVLPMTGRVCPACVKNVDSAPGPLPRSDPIIDAFPAEHGRVAIGSSGFERGPLARGMDADRAAAFARDRARAEAAKHKEDGQKNMIIGTLWCVGGLVVTAMTYQAAAGQGGGRYVMAWGAVVFGGIQFHRGMIQAAKG